MADRQQGAWRSGNRYALPTSPHPRRRLSEPRDKRVTLTPHWYKTSGMPRGILDCDHQTLLTSTACQVFRHELRYLSLLRYQRAGHETCQRQNLFYECHKITFRFERCPLNASSVMVGSFLTRIATRV